MEINGGKVPLEEPKKMLSLRQDSAGKYFVEINSSSLDIIQTCPKKSQYALVSGLTSKEPGLAVTFGKGVHKALEIMYETPRDERLLVPNYKANLMRMAQGQSLEDESNFAFKAMRGFLEETGPLSDLPIEDKRSLVNGAYLLGEYFETRYQDPYEVMLKDGKPLVETMYSHIIHDDAKLQIKIFGTIDAIMENKANGQVVVCDHKTTSATFMGDFYNRTKPNLQFTLYIYLTQKCLGLNVENFMINVFQVKPRPKTSRGKGPDFLNIITKRTPQDIEEALKTVHYWVTQYISWYENNYWPYGSVNACSMYGACTFNKVCSAPEAIREAILEAEYEPRGIGNG